MRVCLQRVSRASVTVNGEVTGAIGGGYMLLVGITQTDTAAEIDLLANKIVNLRILEDEHGVMNVSALDSGAVSMLVVSQFTLYGDVRKGRRPSWAHAAPPEMAAPMVDAFCDALRAQGFTVETGVFGAEMAVELVNDGPVTIWLDTEDLRAPRRG
ncbi:MAG: D-aminoacyl-tRNA deacylase [Thermomicrobiales bacterium]|nr:D-aminoacyl-tRNA deacylase [Thermomicrobiales bacterium]MCO5219410.1 D-aminoacyl-tRNA deacylase [Thermomicrobiales bacterium]